MATPTIAELEAEYLDNRDYTGDATKMQAALSALRGIRILRGNQFGSGGGTLSFELVSAEIANLEKQLAAITRTASMTLVRPSYF